MVIIDVSMVISHGNCRMETKINKIREEVNDFLNNKIINSLTNVYIRINFFNN